MQNVKFSNGTYGELINITVPTKTNSYSPVSHKNIMNEIEEELDKKNLIIRDQSFKMANNGNKVIGYYDIETSNADMGMRLAWRNSYDKSMSAAFVAGSQVWICSNGLISGDIQFMRKHTGEINKELKSKINEGINYLDVEFDKHIKMKENSSDIKIDKKLTAELCGRMFIEEDIITSTQLGIIKKELEESTYEEFVDPTVWNFYNKITHALKTSYPTEYIDRHVKLHKFFEKEFELI